MQIEEDKEKKERFFKHRRNTLLLSAIALFMLFAGGEIEKLSLLGNSIKFERPEVPLQLVILALIYMVIKYWQYLNELGGTGIFRALDHLISGRVPHVARKVRLKQYPSEEVIPLDYFKIIEYNGFLRYTVREVIDPEKDGALEEEISKALGSDYQVTKRHLWLTYLIVSVKHIIRTTWFGEYIMPLLLAVIAIAAYFFSSVVVALAST
ncbi:hypothetical protein [Microbulbifer sp. HZ11]|uniref:hypothetical protein n=1 Tax=Microbulbifer sp. HZ11 TaxID=1453501 RepID=UPI0005BCDF64|nr:hypothetical protein [Microbulbifer sp. HZ11]